MYERAAGNNGEWDHLPGLAVRAQRGSIVSISGVSGLVGMDANVANVASKPHLLA